MRQTVPQRSAVAERVACRLATGCLALALAMLWGACSRSEPPALPAPIPAVDAAPAPIQPPPPPVVRPRLSEGERRAIAEAREGGELDRQDAARAAATDTAAEDEAGSPASESKKSPPVALTRADRAAADDDPALRIRRVGGDVVVAPVAADAAGSVTAPVSAEVPMEAQVIVGAGPDAAEPAAREPTEPSSGADPTGTTPDAGGADDAGSEISKGVRVWPDASRVSLSELIVSPDVVERRPVGSAAHFDAVPPRFYCYTAVRNPDPEAQITHVWRRNGKVLARIDLSVKRSRAWRTWSRQRAKPGWTGRWSCEVLGPEGQRIGLAEFTVGGGPR